MFCTFYSENTDFFMKNPIQLCNFKIFISEKMTSKQYKDVVLDHSYCAQSDTGHRVQHKNSDEALQKCRRENAERQRKSRARKQELA